MKLSNEVSNRIAVLRPILIFGVVFVHVAGLSDNPSKVEPGLFMTFASYFKNAVFRSTVPTMSLIAGFLLFSFGLDQALVKLFKKKFMTMFVPFVILNVACYLMMNSLNSTFGPEVYPGLHLLQQTTDGWNFDRLNNVFGFTVWPVNRPLYFVRDILVTLLFVPVLSSLIRATPWMGLLALTVIFGTNQDGALIMRGTTPILFYIGGMAAVYKWNVLAGDKYARHCLVAFLVACGMLIGFRIDDNTLLVIVAPFLIWPAASLLKNTKIEAWAMMHSKYSFFVFSAHWPLLLMEWWFVKVHAQWIPFPVFWFASPILTILVLKGVYDASMRFAPNVFKFVIGDRAKKAPALIDRRKALRPINAPIWTAEQRIALFSKSSDFLASADDYEHQVVSGMFDGK